MTKIGELAYFLNSLKEIIPFKDDEDFQKKIKEKKEFRIKIQKLVYLSKFFGWDNNYHFNFHERGPYSIELSENYQSIRTLGENEFFDFDIKSFKEFIENKNINYLEASSTILYYYNKIKPMQINKERIITILTYLKPNISKDIIEKSVDRLNKFNILNNNNLEESEMIITEQILLDKINGIYDIFENFEECSNQTLILGSLDYIKIALKKESLEVSAKNNFLKTLYDYVDEIENYYFENYTLSKSFTNHDLKIIDDKFDKVQDYISDLNIIPRLYDEDIDLNIFYD